MMTTNMKCMELREYLIYLERSTTQNGEKKYTRTQIYFDSFLQRKHHLCPKDWRMFLLFKEKMLCLPVN